jgi:hypothetical protein
MTSFEGQNPRGRRSRLKDTQHMYAVRYADGSSAYIRVDPKAAEYGTAPVIGLAKEQQASGTIPDGEIVSVQRVK